MMRAQGWSLGDWLTAEDAESAEEEGAVWGEGHATGGSAQASPPRAAAKHVARVESPRLLFCEVNLCHPPMSLKKSRHLPSLLKCFDSPI